MRGLTWRACVRDKDEDENEDEDTHRHGVSRWSWWEAGGAESRDPKHTYLRFGFIHGWQTVIKWPKKRQRGVKWTQPCAFVLSKHPANGAHLERLTRVRSPPLQFPIIPSRSGDAIVRFHGRLFTGPTVRMIQTIAATRRFPVLPKFYSTDPTATRDWPKRFETDDLSCSGKAQPKGNPLLGAGRAGEAHFLPLRFLGVVLLTPPYDAVC